MKKGKLINLKQTTSAAISVQEELYKVGLWYNDSRLTQANVFWCSLPVITIPDAHAFFLAETNFWNRLLGWEPGHIYIPKYVVAQHFLQERGSLRDIIRHEYGHVFAYYYPELIEHSPEFDKVFGGGYEDTEPSNMEDEAYVSDYAKTIPMEDYAETFMVYVRRKGILPTHIKNTKLKRKWNFIKKTIKGIHLI